MKILPSNREKNKILTMDIFWSQLANITPVFVLIALGWISGKYLHIKDASPISKLLLYIFTPVLVFDAINKANLDSRFLVVPLFFFFICSFVCLLSYFVSRFIWEKTDKTRNIIAYSSGSGNVAFYGVPVALILFGESSLALISLAIIGFILYDSTIGYVIASGEDISFKGVINKLIKFPPLIALLVALVLKAFSAKIDPTLNLYSFLLVNSQKTIATLGIMLIGISLANFKFEIDIKYITYALLAKFLIWPLLVVGLMAILSSTGLINFKEVGQIMLLIGSVPVATNSVILANTFNVKPDKASVGVFVTAIASLIMIPLWNYLYRIVL